MAPQSLVFSCVGKFLVYHNKQLLGGMGGQTTGIVHDNGHKRGMLFPTSSASQVISSIITMVKHCINKQYLLYIPFTLKMDWYLEALLYKLTDISQ